jgi:hypothetical protein
MTHRIAGVRFDKPLMRFVATRRAEVGERGARTLEGRTS